MSDRTLLVASVVVVLALLSAPLIVGAPSFASVVRSVYPEYRPVRILFGGDMMFDRTVRREAARRGGDFLFECLDPLLTRADLVVANLEGPVTDNPSVSLGSTPGDSNNFTFTFPTTTAPLLYAHNVRMVNLGNNHIMNFGLDGLSQTRQYLDAAGVQYFGDPELSDIERTVRKDIQGIPFSFINWSEWTPLEQAWAMRGESPTYGVERAIKLEAEEGRIVVVYTHWGEEYVPATARVKRMARSFIDAGATIVVGSHPHVVQEHEIYRDRYIYYSLGNMIFDQYWMPEVSNGLMLEVLFGNDGVLDIKEIPVELKRDRQTCPVTSSAAPEGPIE